jgi:hypothetical protein
MQAESKSISQKKSAPPSPIIFAFIVLGVTASGVGVMVFFFNPSTHGFYPVCLFHSLTGLNCPGCGSTRALYALLHGDFRLALKDNALFVLTFAALILSGVRCLWQKTTGRATTFNVPAKFLWLFLATAFVFAVIRNLPGFDWLSP